LHSPGGANSHAWSEFDPIALGSEVQQNAKDFRYSYVPHGKGCGREHNESTAAFLILRPTAQGKFSMGSWWGTPWPST
jgi:hypothetical protein